VIHQTDDPHRRPLSRARRKPLRDVVRGRVTNEEPELETADNVAAEAAPEATRAFWSGPGTQEAAQTWASENGGVTMDMTPEGQEVLARAAAMSEDEAQAQSRPVLVNSRKCNWLGPDVSFSRGD
jgi:hypothetical protein